MKGGLGQMPLTLFVVVAGIILYLHVRRANLGIDKAPSEGAPAAAPAPTVRIPYSAGGAPPVLQPVPGTPAGPALTPFEAWMNKLLHSINPYGPGVNARMGPTGP